MIRLVEEKDVICQIELEMHYNPVIVRLKELVKNGEIGKIKSFNATNITLSPVWAFPWQGVPEKSYGKRVPIKEGDSRFRGGALCDHPHIFDMIRHMTGSDFDSIYAEVAPNIRPDIEEEDMLSVIGKMKDGPGWEVFPKRMEVNITLNGENGTIMSDCFGPNVYHNGLPNDRYTVQYTYFDEWIGLVDEFYDNIRNHKTPLINLKWHKKTIEAMNAVYESISTGKTVML